MMDLYIPAIKEAVKSALNEDIGTGDITTLAVVDPDTLARARFVCQEEGILAGLDVVAAVYDELSPLPVTEKFLSDGCRIKPGDLIAEVKGPAQTLLIGERVALNFLQRLSGVATLSRAYADAISDTRAAVVDTRKTTPGLRILEKYAVRVGGAANHRFGLYDGVLIKDNHIVAAGGIIPAVEKARKSVPHTIKIEVECENRQHVLEALEARADIIMLDNMDIADIAEMVELIAGRAIVEASGNVTLDKVRKVAECGVDLISVGRLTRSAPALDISLDLELL
jgi:nicotinate-nucleotide pyrophosphorylase (carboxylating)